MRAIWKGFISFGLVTIPVGVGIAQQRRDVSFRTLSRESLVPVKQKRWDPVRDVEVGPDEVVKGYEVAKGQYVTVEEEELERFAARQEKTIEILQFVELPEVDPVYFEKAYWIEPQERAERPYALLAEAMRRTGRGALGRFVLSTKEHLVLIRPSPGGALLLQTLYYASDLRRSEEREIADRLEGVQVTPEELGMAEQLVEGLSKDFAADAHENTTRLALMQYLEAKAAGQEPVIAPESAEPAPVVDLMAALKASLAAAGVSDGAAKPARKPRAPKAATPGDEGGPREQLSIDQGRLRGIEGGSDEDAGDAAEEAPKKRVRKAS